MFDAPIHSDLALKEIWLIEERLLNVERGTLPAGSVISVGLEVTGQYDEVDRSGRVFVGTTKTSPINPVYTVETYHLKVIAMVRIHHGVTR